ncbi:heme lyase [Aliivibrio sp. S4TY2]|uniref:TPR domain-containing protein n=1 Tax=unclassified Aliivibrio TaxID=2645654 RepID=UPI0023791C0B|nr:MULTISPECIES: heme lyase [unclassified Aliivibrio]MDD9155498.1 heme lyase [Aliivibrio sp. S4TY2]MDD9160365.1 heme lyase [Aliivibrio sp. S4TY1]MDD9164737.1 heme lyase [Aliivibrio sp. S4MY2]MDD9168543.1 heme lyase [Aliivibrio sp. S4MY4]MDD9185071.1 heme lyase [Aliivibrio sp. S4MY3]
MIIMMLLSFVIIAAVLWWFYSRDKATSLNPAWMIFFVVISMIVIFSSGLRPEKFAVNNKAITEPLGPLSYSDKMRYLEDQLKASPNDADLWFEIGQGYLLNGEFSNASICFDYALRLTDEPTANQYAAKATTLYYAHSQIIDEEIQALLDKVLELDEYNQAALTLIASDHFVTFRYQKAINAWQKILDSERVDVDRITIINSINQAKELMQARR